MSYETLLYDVADGVATITFNRPDAANAMSPLCAREFNLVSLEVEGNPEVRAVVITGNGKMFCAGGDLKDRDGMTDEQWQQQHAIFEQVVRGMRDCPDRPPRPRPDAPSGAPRGRGKHPGPSRDSGEG